MGSHLLLSVGICELSVDRVNLLASLEILGRLVARILEILVLQSGRQVGCAPSGDAGLQGGSIVAVFLLAVVIDKSLLAAIPSQSIVVIVELTAQVLVVPVPAIDEFDSLGSINVIVIVTCKHLADCRLALLCCAARAIVAGWARALVQTGALAISVPYYHLIIEDDILKWGDPLILQLSGTCLTQKLTCLLKQFIPENDLILELVYLSVSDLQLDLCSLVLGASFNVFDD